jgi:hypothetical protein
MSVNSSITEPDLRLSVVSTTMFCKSHSPFHGFYGLFLFIFNSKFMYWNKYRVLSSKETKYESGERDNVAHCTALISTHSFKCRRTQWNIYLIRAHHRINWYSAFIFAETHLLSSTEIRTKSVLHLREVDLKDLTLVQTDILHTMRCECRLILEKIL